MMQQYDDALTAVSFLYKNELKMETKCLIPCSFTEFQVKTSLKSLRLRKLLD